MKKFSKNFRENLREVREINAIISYYENDKYLMLATESEENLTTENSDFIVTQNLKNNFSGESIIRINPSFNVDLFKSVCKSLEAEIKNKIPINTKINVRVGVKVNGKYEYLDYGNYFVRECSYQADSQTYLIIAYDKMYQSMISYDENNANITYPISIKNLLIKICNYLKWDYDFGEFVNQNKIINKDLFKGQGLTYRDILDNISQVIVGNLMFDDKDNLVIKYINNSSENDIEVNEYDLKNVNVEMIEKYGNVNALLITTNENVVLNNRVNNISIQQNGKTELKINDNYILINNSDDFIDEMFNKINGLEYYIYDVDTIGILVLDPLDRFNIKINDTTYSTLMLNDDTQIDTGIVEKCYADKPELNVSEYKPTNANENKLNNAVISLDKANAEIVMKVTGDGKLAQVRLDGNASDGSIVEIQADNINMKGVVNAINDGTTTINGSKITTGTITANQIQSGTITADKVSSDIITTTNFNAQNINANKITSGTLSTNRLESKVITTDNFSAQNINANKITSGAITTAGIDVANSTGFLRMLYANWANHPYVSALNVAGQLDYPNKNGTNSSISFRSEEFKENTGSQVGFITFGKLGDGIIGASGNLRLISNDQIYIGQLTIKGTTLYGDYTGSTSETDVTGKPYITQFNNTYINPRFYAYIGGESKDSNLILTKGGSPSSKNLKTNIKLITEYENIYNDFKKINFYTYDYKYKGINDKNNDFGFIIDEIEENETLSKYYKNYSKEGYIDNDKNMFPKREGMIYKNMEHINYKVWDRDAYLKMNMVLIKSLQNKIEELEKRIKEMEESK